ncbi:MAG: hypothetical protein NZ927_02265 [Candidatus Calescibacterium sp.]|nr:hypothetical protein [Candidatus Calescibacterium sp.]MCX7734350.1 hypothetical protein [bacterium]MDW8086886.1 hypothetical protein [Candidatus Calescibacterium sp.]
MICSEYINRLGVFAELRDIREDLRKEVEALIDITKTWLYQEGKQEGIQKWIQEGTRRGIKEGTREALLLDIRTKFSKVPGLIRKEIEGIEDVNRLRILKSEVVKSRTLKEFERKLRSLRR